MSYQKTHYSLIFTNYINYTWIVSFFLYKFDIFKIKQQQKTQSKKTCKKHVMLHKEYATSKVYLAYSFTLTRFM